MKTSDIGIQFITFHEAVRLKPYKDCVGLWTTGIGHLIGDGKSLPDEWNRKLTLEEAFALLRYDLQRFERGVERLVPIPLQQCEFDALVSFSYNLGLGALQCSTLRKKLLRGDREGAANEILKWNKAGGIVVKGLVTRRRDSRMLFFGW